MDESQEQSEARDFGEILNQRVQGHLPLVVGGHAVNIWALIYKDRIHSELVRENLLPLTSKDLDLYGVRELLEELKRKFGGSLVIGEARSPVIGRLEVTLSGKQRKIEVLRSVRGMNSSDLEDGTLEVAFEGYSARVPLLASLLRAKLANVSQIEQKDRNDLRHVRILLLVIREYLADVIQLIELEELDPRLGIKMLEETRTIISSDDADRCIRRHGISFDGIWPREKLQSAGNEKVRKFVEHRLPRMGK